MTQNTSFLKFIKNYIHHLEHIEDVKYEFDSKLNSSSSINDMINFYEQAKKMGWYHYDQKEVLDYVFDHSDNNELIKNYIKVDNSFKFEKEIVLDVLYEYISEGDGWDEDKLSENTKTMIQKSNILKNHLEK